MLRWFLDYHRAVLWRKADGLTEAQSRTTVAPSSITMLGLMRHMAFVEQYWHAIIFSGLDEQRHWKDDDNWDRDFQPHDHNTLMEAISLFETEVARARSIELGASSLDDLSKAPRHGDHPSLRWIIIHMIEEYARHCGHADFIRQAIDGSTGD
jgi:Protein of unknown function (DUF664)